MGLRSSTTPLERYHGVPAGWTKTELIALHNTLGGTFPIDGEEASEPGAPAWLPDRYNWLQYRETLRRIAQGIQQKDPACIEIAIRYIELNYFGSYSGYLKARFAQLIKPQSLSKNQQIRLLTHFEYLIKAKHCLQEFKEYNKLRQRLVQFSRN